MGNIEKIMTREAISQLLADAGINRETLLDMVNATISDKVEKAVARAIHDRTDINTIASRLVEKNIEREVVAAVRKALGFISVSMSVDHVQLGSSEPGREVSK